MEYQKNNNFFLHKIDNKITRVSKNSQEKHSETVTIKDN